MPSLLEAAKMTPAQIAGAKRLAREWKPKKELLYKAHVLVGTVRADAHTFPYHLAATR